MNIRHHTAYTLDYYERDHDTDHMFPLPFDPEGDPQHIYIAPNGLKAVLAFLVRDDSPADPFEEHDEGEFYQFNSCMIHDTSRPEIDDFKRIVRANPGRVVTVASCSDGYRAGTLITPAMCRNINSKSGRPVTSPAERELDSADGYYIVPEDATDPLQYATGSIEIYSQWCQGDVYGVVVWTYTRESIADDWTDDPERNECWRYYGSDGYTAYELLSQFRYAIAGNDPSQEATTAC